MGRRQQLSVNFALKKCPRHACTREDRISQLPDDILVHILAFLSIKEATYTSVLSKRWLHLWKYIPWLDFDATEPLYQVYLNHKLRKRHMKKYVRWVNHTLVKCKLEVLKITVTDGLEYFGQCKFPEFTNLKKFVVCVHAWEDKTLLGCTNVIEAAPLLEEFELKLFWFKPLRLNRECRKIVSCPLHHLKVIRLCGYFGRTCEVELVKYFLENAIVLEKIVIDPRYQNVSRVLSPSTIEKEQMWRNFAKLQLEGEVPPHIELVIL